MVDKSYPPTHEGELLEKRIRLIEENFPNFFRGNRFLDIGCNKGAFSELAKPHFKEVVSIDKEDYGYGRIISFRDFYDSKQFDRIFLGNINHHLFNEIKSWAWIGKLAALSIDQVLVEGPVSTKCEDVRRIIPQQFHAEFDKFLDKMSEYFELIKCVPSIDYTPDRYVMLFKRRFKEYSGTLIYKRFKKDNYIDNNIVDILVAASSPFETPVVSWDDRGWYEPRMNFATYGYFENEGVLFKIWCKHNLFLSKLGYIDFDPATINFFKPCNLHFDKSACMPILKISEGHADMFERLLTQSYRTIPESIIKKIKSAMVSRDSRRLEEVWNEIVERWPG